MFFAAHVIAMSSTIYNPFLYAWMNDNFNKEFRQVIPCLFFSRGSTSGNTSYTQYTNVGTDVQSGVLNRSPLKNGNDNAALMKDSKAYYDADSEKIHLNVVANNSGGGGGGGGGNNAVAAPAAVGNHHADKMEEEEKHELQRLKGEEEGEKEEEEEEDADTCDRLIEETAT